MIKLQSVHKYYDKGKSNELHVIDDTTLELPSAGLISFFGKSGSGKTTLLNVVGGLDSFSEGSISYDGKEMKKYDMGEADKYRRSHVGYIFQNYLLLENKTVYENLRIALDTIGITDEEEQQKRIKYVLTAVGLYKFRKKPAGNLSGGQMQRVSIARALLKECRVIIADEPTGNLDSENTIEVMNILKKISRNTLVLLVTHNREIADFYSDRVIELKDGKIEAEYDGASSFGEEKGSKLDVKHEKKVYLKDLKKQETDGENLKINLYTAEETPRKIELNIVVKNNTVYLDSPENLVVVRDGNIQLIDDHYRAINREDVNEFSFDISWYDDGKKKTPFKRILTSLKSAMANFWFVPKKKRFFHFIFAFIGMMMGVCMLAANTFGNVDVSYASTEPGLYALIDSEETFEYYETPQLSANRLREAVNKGYVEDAFIVRVSWTNISYRYNTRRSVYGGENCYPFPYSRLPSDCKILAGGAPSNGKEALLGKKAADSFLEQLEFKDYKNLLGMRLHFNSQNADYTICGVCEADNNSCYVLSLPSEDYKYPVTEDYPLTEDKIGIGKPVLYQSKVEYTLTGGREIEGENEVLINEKFSDRLGESIIVDIYTYNDYGGFTAIHPKYTIVGTFATEGDDPPAYLLTTDATIAGGTFYYNETAAGSYYSVSVERYSSPSVHLLKEFTGEIDTTLNEKSRLPMEGQEEALVHAYSGYKIGERIEDTTIFVTGYFYTEDTSQFQDVYMTVAAKITYVTQTASTFENVYYQLSDGAKSGLKALKIKTYTPAEFAYQTDRANQKVEFLVFLVIALILLAIIILYVYFSTRSRLISQIKSVGIYRCMGASRWQILKKYMADILVETTFTTLIGYLIIVCASSLLSNVFEYMSGMSLALNPFFAILGGVALYAVNLIFGLLPVVLLLTKTPAEINSKYDI